MEQKQRQTLMEAMVLVKRMGNLYTETMEVSRQLADAADRQDPVVVRLLVNQRADPIEQLGEAKEQLHELCNRTEEPLCTRLRELLNGGQPGDSKEEVMLANLVASNHRVLTQLIDLDRVLNQKLNRDHALYS